MYTIILKAKDIIQQLTNQVSALMLKLNGMQFYKFINTWIVIDLKIILIKYLDGRKEQIATEEIKNQFYAQLENEFQCSICSDLIYKVSIF